MGLSLVRSLLFAPLATASLDLESEGAECWRIMNARIFVPAILQAIASPEAPVDWLQECMLCVAQLANVFGDRKCTRE